MGKKYPGGITTTAGFQYNANYPLDDRLVVETYADLITLNKYKGITVYVDDEDKYYYYDGTTWVSERNSILDYLKYTVTDYITITDCDNTANGLFRLPSTIKGFPIYQINDSAFSNCNKIFSLIIPETVQTIGDAAFSKCTSLAYIKIPNSVHTIGNNAFAGCSSSNFNFVEVPEGVYSLGTGAFRNCSSLQVVILPETLIKISSNTFSDCSKLRSVTIPNNVTSIESMAFSGCKALTSINIPHSVTSINSKAFYNCTGLTDIYYEGTKEEWAALGFTTGDAITVHFNQSARALEETKMDKFGEVKVGTSTRIITYKNTDDYSHLPPFIGDASYGVYQVSDIQLPLEDYIGCECTYLDSEGQNITHIITADDIIEETSDTGTTRRALFVGGSESITVFESEITQDDGTVVKPGIYFMLTPESEIGMEYTLSIEIPNGALNIIDTGTNHLIVKSSKAISLEIPDGPNIKLSDDGKAYYNNNELVTKVDTENKLDKQSTAKYFTYTINGSSSKEVTITGLNLDKLLLDVTNNTAPDSLNVNVVTVPDIIDGCPVTTIGFEAFHGFFEEVLYVYLPESITTIEERAFAGCYRLQYINLPENIRTIGSSAFSGCFNLKVAKISESTTIINKDTFYGCNSAKIFLPNTITSIDADAIDTGCSCTIYYGGTKEEWEAIGYTPPSSVTVYYNQSVKALDEVKMDKFGEYNPDESVITASSNTLTLKDSAGKGQLVLTPVGPVLAANDGSVSIASNSTTDDNGTAFSVHESHLQIDCPESGRPIWGVTTLTEPDATFADGRFATEELLGLQATSKSYVDNQINNLDSKVNTLASTKLKREVVTELPDVVEGTENTIYMVGPRKKILSTEIPDFIDINYNFPWQNGYSGYFTFFSQVDMYKYVLANEAGRIRVDFSSARTAFEALKQSSASAYVEYDPVNNVFTKFIVYDTSENETGDNVYDEYLFIPNRFSYENISYTGPNLSGVYQGKIAYIGTDSDVNSGYYTLAIYTEDSSITFYVNNDQGAALKQNIKLYDVVTITFADNGAQVFNITVDKSKFENIGSTITDLASKMDTFGSVVDNKVVLGKDINTLQFTTKDGYESGSIYYNDTGSELVLSNYGIKASASYVTMGDTTQLTGLRAPVADTDAVPHGWANNTYMEKLGSIEDYTDNAGNSRKLLKLGTAAGVYNLNKISNKTNDSSIAFDTDLILTAGGKVLLSGTKRYIPVATYSGKSNGGSGNAIDTMYTVQSCSYYESTNSWSINFAATDNMPGGGFGFTPDSTNFTGIPAGSIISLSGNALNYDTTIVITVYSIEQVGTTITGVATPDIESDAANKLYVDNSIAERTTQVQFITWEDDD